MALKKFKKEETNKKNVIKIVSAFMVIGIMLAGISYAVYQHEDEKLFINAKVGEFKENDIELTMKLDGEQIDKPPAKDNYIITVDCDNATGRWNNNEWAAVIGNITSNRVKCEVNFKTPEATLSEVTATSKKTEISLSYKAEGIVTKTTCKYGTEEGNYVNNVDNVTNTNCNIKELDTDTTYYYQVCVEHNDESLCKEGNIRTRPLIDIGDYISMTPTATSYTISTSVTGYTSNQTINPSELNLWRVIRRNGDGTIEVVSEYVSSAEIYFRGKTGYLNFVGGLNTIAAQYTDGKHVQSTRHMGYSNQILKCTSFSASACPGDTGYTIDTGLVETAIGTLIAKKPNGVDSHYWLAYRDIHTSSLDGITYFYGGRLTSSATHQARYLILGGSESESSWEAPVRPILILKPDVKVASGDGSSASTAYTFT